MKETDIPIWPDEAPGAPDPLPPHILKPRADGGFNAVSVAVPSMTNYRPDQPNGHAILLCQGGGYGRVGQVSLMPQWFCDRGFHVFDLIYRLPHQGWTSRADVPLQDAQQAMRIIRSQSQDLGINGQIGVMGFSSGGHVAGSLATRFAEEVSPDTPVDPALTRPDFAILFCSVITMVGEAVHDGSRLRLFGDTHDEAEFRKRSVELRVTPQTPPTCLVHAEDDDVVSVENALGMFAALKAAGVSAQMHLPEIGGHRMSNCFRPDTPLTGYGELVLSWLLAVTGEQSAGDQP